jgi:hypothetical protein
MRFTRLIVVLATSALVFVSPVAASGSCIVASAC